MGSGCTEPEYAVAPALSMEKQMRTASAISPAVRPPMTSVQCPTGNYDDSAVTSVAFSLGCAVRVLFSGRDLVERHSRRVGRGRRTSSRGVVQRSACARIETGAADEGRERFVSDTSSSPASPRRRSCALRTSRLGRDGRCHRSSSRPAAGHQGFRTVMWPMVAVLPPRRD